MIHIARSVLRKAPYTLVAGGFVAVVILGALLWGKTHSSEVFATIPGEPQVSSTGSAETPQDNVSSGGAPTITIDKIGVVMPIVEGKNETALLKGAWRSPYGSTPDKGGNTVLFGHRWYHKPPHPETFYNLDKLVIGDTFVFDWEGKIHTYKVVETKIVNPEDVFVLAPTARPSVTLITCTPLFTTKQRLVVRGELQSE